MDIWAFLFLGTIAFVWTLFLVAVATVSSADHDSLATFGGVTGVILWLVWSFRALNYTASSGGTGVTYSSPELALVGLVMAWVPGYIALVGPIELVGRWQEGDLERM